MRPEPNHVPKPRGHLGGAFPAAVCASATLRDEDDALALNYALMHGERVVGSLRVLDLERSPDPTPAIATYQLQPLVKHFGVRAFTLAGRLALDGSYRDGCHLTCLVERGYIDARARGIRFAASDCSPELWPLYRRFGYRVCGAPFKAPVFGVKLPMVWPLGDLETMRRRKSPFAATAARLADDPEARDWCDRFMGAVDNTERRSQ